jgi:hypothetical protein
MTDLNRRSSLLILSGTILATSEGAFGQASLKYMRDDIANVVDLQRFAVGFSPESKELVPSLVKFVELGVDIRRKAVEDANNSGVFADPDKAIGDIKSSVGIQIKKDPDYYITSESVSSQIEAIQFVSKNGVSLVPDIRDILPIGIPVAEPIVPEDQDSDVSVALDIALQTIGMFDTKQNYRDV